jgi:xylulokinase
MRGHGQVIGSREAVLGIDLGTSGVKALVAGLDGRALGRGVAGYPVRVPAPGRAETAAEDWWLATRSAVRAALAEADLVTVTALAVAGPLHGVVLADDRGAALRPAILGLDQRAAAEAAAYAELPCDYTAALANQPAPGMAGPLLCWLATHEPNSLRASWWVLQPKDWLRLRLTGRAATDPTDASGTLLFDPARGQWACPLIDKLGLPRDKLPPVRPSAEIAGPLLPSPAAGLGLPPGIPVAVGTSDTAAALFAAQSDREPGLGKDDVLLTLGRGAQWAVPVPPLPPAAAPDAGHPGPSPATDLYRAVGDGHYRLADVRHAGSTLDWVRNLVGATWDELYATAARPPACRREDLMRGALDGVAVLLRQRLDDLRAAGHAPRRVILSGGGTAHPAWRALLEETFALPLVQARTPWLAPAGAARLATQAAAR